MKKCLIVLGLLACNAGVHQLDKTPPDAGWDSVPDYPIHCWGDCTPERFRDAMIDPDADPAAAFEVHKR